MLDYTPEAAAAIESSERAFRTRLRVDWARNGFDHPLADMSEYVSTWKREQTLSSNAPDELMLIEGNAAAKLTVDLTGEYDGEPLAWQFAPFRTDSVFYDTGFPAEGAPVELDVAVWTSQGWEWFPQFRGLVREATTDRVDAEAVLDCLDNAELMRSKVDLVPYAPWQPWLQQGFKRGQLIDSSSLVDLAARAGGFDAGPQGMSWPAIMNEPPYSAGVSLSVPFHGSILPEVGTLDGDQGIHRTEALTGDRAEAYRAGPFGYLARNAAPASDRATSYHKFWIDERDRNVASSASSTFVLGGWFYWAGPDVDPDAEAIKLQIRSHQFILALESSNGACLARMRFNTSYPNNAWDTSTNNPAGTWETITGPFSSLPAQPGWHYYQVKFKWYSAGVPGAGDIWMQAGIDGRDNPSVLVANRAHVDRDDRFSGLVWIRNTWSVSDVTIWDSGNKPPLENFTYNVNPRGNALVSWGRNRMTHTTRETFESFNLAKAVAGAEYGVIYFDEHGRFRFENYDDVTARRDQIVRTFTIDHLDNLRFRSTLDTVRTQWSVKTQSAQTVAGIAYDLAKDGVPYQVRGGEYLPVAFNPPNNTGTVYFVPQRANLVCVNPWGIPTHPEGTPWDDEIPRHGKQAYTNTTPHWDMSATSEQKPINRNWLRLWFWNGYDVVVGFVNPSNQARFRIEGWIIAEDPEKVWTIEAEDATGDARVIELSGKWLQDEYQTRNMLAGLVARMARPIPVCDDITVPGDPRIQPLDAVMLVDADGFGRIPAQIFGLTREGDDTGRLTDTYRVEAVQPPGPSYWDGTTPADRWDYGHWS